MTNIQTNKSFFDFIDIVYEALETAPRRLFEKMVYFILSQLRQQNMELQRLALEVDEMHSIPFDDLDDFYDNLLDEMENITLFKSKLEKLKEKDNLFDELYRESEKLITSLTNYMDRVGQLEVRVLQKSEELV